MTDVIPDKSVSASPLGAWLFATVFWAAGSAMVALAAGWIPSAPERFVAPHWVVGAAGLLFIGGGFAPLSERSGPDSWWSRLVGASVLGPLTLIFNWIAFGSGTRHFTGGLSVAGALISQGPVSEAGGRAVFAVAAVALDLAVMVIAMRWVRSKPDGSGG